MLQFKLVDKNQNGLNAQLLLDNVFFTDEVVSTALDLITGEGNAAAQTVMAAADASPEPNNSSAFNSNLNLSWNAPNEGDPNKLIDIKVDGQFDRFLQVDYQGYKDLSPATDIYRFELEAGGPNLTFTTTPLSLHSSSCFNEVRRIAYLDKVLRIKSVPYQIENRYSKYVRITFGQTKPFSAVNPCLFTTLSKKL